MTQTTSQTLPEYESPPINEVVCGIQFERIEKFLNPYLGMLWEKYKPEYSECQEAAPLVPAIEQFDSPAQPGTFYVDVPALPRTWFIRSEGNSLIQVQRDRFLHNWREIRPDDVYPHYRHIIEEFQLLFAKFTSFLKEQNIGVVIPLQYELTYINLIPQGQGWDTIGDVEKVFPNFTWQRSDDGFLPSPETVDWNTNFVLPEKAGRLHTKVQTALRRTDGLPFLRFELTARGIGAFNTLDTMWNWFEVAHEYIVRGFAELTASEVQRQIWRQRK